MEKALPGKSGNGHARLSVALRYPRHAADYPALISATNSCRPQHRWCPPVAVGRPEVHRFAEPAAAANHAQGVISADLPGDPIVGAPIMVCMPTVSGLLPDIAQHVRETEGVAPVAPRLGGKDYAIITRLQVSGRGGFSRPPCLVSARPWAAEAAPTAISLPTSLEIPSVSY